MQILYLNGIESCHNCYVKDQQIKVKILYFRRRNRNRNTQSHL